MAFMSKLDKIFLSKTQIKLTANLVYHDEDFGIIIDVPSGFKSDGLSVPKLFRWFQKPFGKGLEAGIIHDFILESKDVDLTFLEADAIFENCLKDLGVNFFHRYLLKLATDLNGVVIHHNIKPNNMLENQK